MKAWLGDRAYDLTPEQFKEMNRIAEEARFAAGDDTTKGFEAAVRYCKENKFPVLVKKVRMMESQTGALLPENPEALAELVAKMVAEALAQAEAARKAAKKPAAKKKKSTAKS